MKNSSWARLLVSKLDWCIECLTNQGQVCDEIYENSNSSFILFGFMNSFGLAFWRKIFSRCSHVQDWRVCKPIQFRFLLSEKFDPAFSSWFHSLWVKCECKSLSLYPERHRYVESGMHLAWISVIFFSTTCPLNFRGGPIFARQFGSVELQITVSHNVGFPSSAGIELVPTLKYVVKWIVGKYIFPASPHLPSSIDLKFSSVLKWIRRWKMIVTGAWNFKYRLPLELIFIILVQDVPRSIMFTPETISIFVAK